MNGQTYEDVPIGMYAMRWCGTRWTYCTGKCSECEETKGYSTGAETNDDYFGEE